MEGQSKGAVPSPVVQSLIICDEVIVDRETGKYSLIGVFDRLVAGKFPAKHPKLAIFSELVNGHGQYELRISLVDAKTDTEVISATLPVTFPDPLQSLRIYMRWMNVVFPKPSEYRFQVWEGHELLMEKRLIVLEPPKEEPEDA